MTSSLDEQIAAHVSEMKADGSLAQCHRYAALLRRSGRDGMAKAFQLVPDNDPLRDLSGWLKANHPSGWLKANHPLAWVRVMRTREDDGTEIRLGYYYPHVLIPDDADAALLIPSLDALLEQIGSLETATSSSSSGSYSEEEDDE